MSRKSRRGDPAAFLLAAASICRKREAFHLPRAGGNAESAFEPGFAASIRSGTDVPGIGDDGGGTVEFCALQKISWMIVQQEVWSILPGIKTFFLSLLYFYAAYGNFTPNFLIYMVKNFAEYETKRKFFVEF